MCSSKKTPYNIANVVQTDEVLLQQRRAGPEEHTDAAHKETLDCMRFPYNEALEPLLVSFTLGSGLSKINYQVHTSRFCLWLYATPPTNAGQALVNYPVSACFLCAGVFRLIWLWTQKLPKTGTMQNRQPWHCLVPGKQAQQPQPCSRPREFL